MVSFSETNEILTPSRRRLKRRHFIIFLFVAISSVICVSGLVYLLFFSNIIKVQQFSIQGNRIAGDSDIQELLVKKLNARGWIRRAFGPKNILYWVGVGELNDSEIPAARAIIIHSSIFQRAVTVEIKERQFMGVWCAKTCAGFDSEGVAYFLAPDIEGPLLLKIQDENDNALVLGSPVFSDANVLANIFQSIAIIKESGIVITGVTIKDIAVREWELQNTKGTQFKFSLDFVPEKLKEVLKNIEEKTNGEELHYIDMRVPNRVYFK